MGRCNQVDVVRSGFLQFEHHVCQFLNFCNVAVLEMADRIVLAENTAETASR